MRTACCIETWNEEEYSWEPYMEMEGTRGDIMYLGDGGRGQAPEEIMVSLHSGLKDWEGDPSYFMRVTVAQPTITLSMWPRTTIIGTVHEMQASETIEPCRHYDGENAGTPEPRRDWKPAMVRIRLRPLEIKPEEPYYG